MIFKYNIIDDDSELIIGKCQDIIGLNGKEFVTINNQKFHKLNMSNLKINASFLEFLNKSKEYVSNIKIFIINKNGDKLGEYYFSLKNPINKRLLEKINKNSDYEFLGKLIQCASDEALKLWDIWRNEVPNKPNLWIDLPKRGWLEVVRLYSSQQKLDKKEIQTDIVNLDGKYITDGNSFFCSLGEAINGPGGYFGFDLYSLEDCLCGGFGTECPFKIVWNNPTPIINEIFKSSNKITVYNLDNESLTTNLVIQENEKLFFTELIDLLNRNNIEVIINKN